MNKLGLMGRLVRKEPGHVALTRREPEEWAELLMALSPATRAATASIVWWDFADGAADRRHFTAVFAAWLDEAIGGDYDVDAIYGNLLQLGYCEDVARRRSAEPSTRPSGYTRAARNDYRRGDVTVFV